ncbi:DUF7935 family protein [Myroides indicus]|uniref:Uncharacterized protein n=1 Tax=Myroides indicus TaxID=1323422 RepID=A0A4R7F820_9FLAO|nr:hypothetical protein [Myroides indicus]TDS65051.1 hypothetical protein C8P70_10371 [Myroides indicus]
MNADLIAQIAAYAIPAIVVSILFYFTSEKILQRQAARDRFIIDKLSNADTQIDVKALKLQACERLIIFTERIDLKKLILRITPFSEDKNAYQLLLTQHIEQEFEYNIAQQIYVSGQLWDIITHTKNTIVNTIQQTAGKASVQDAHELRNLLLTESVLIQKSIDVALLAVKEEAKHTMN